MRWFLGLKLKAQIFLVLLIVALIWNLFQFHKLNDERELQPFRYAVGAECGTVIDNFESGRKVKHGYTTDYFLKVKYDTGTQIIKVTPETWINSEVGKQICFTKYKSMIWTGLGAIFTYFLILLCIVMTIIEFLFWVFR